MARRPYSVGRQYHTVTGADANARRMLGWRHVGRCECDDKVSLSGNFTDTVTKYVMLVFQHNEIISLNVQLHGYNFINRCNI
jgi:hypothetical protein